MRERGSVLVETLVATAIAAALLASTASVFASALRGTGRVRTAYEEALALRNVAALLAAGVPVSAVEGDYPAMRLETIGTKEGGVDSCGVGEITVVSPVAFYCLRADD